MIQTPETAREPNTLIEPVADTRAAGPSILTTFTPNPNLPLRPRDQAFWCSLTLGQVSGRPDPCSGVEETEVCPPLESVASAFRPFTIIDLEGCDSTIGGDDHQAIAAQMVEEGTAWALGRELATGRWTGNPSLQSSASVDLTPDSGAVDTAQAWSILEHHFESFSHGRFMVHSPTAVTADMAQKRLIQLVGGSYRGARSMLINPGPGLPGVGPDITGNVDRTAQGEFYLYATRSAGEYRTGEITPYGVDTIITEQNRVVASSSRRAMVRFNPTGVAAIRVSLVRESFSEPFTPPAIEPFQEG